MVVTYDWETVGASSAWMRIHKDNGRLYWNAKVHQYLGFPDTVVIQYDDAQDSISVLRGYDYAVIPDEDGNFYIDALEALEECGLEFPLAGHITAEPSAPANSHNRVIMALS